MRPACGEEGGEVWACGMVGFHEIDWGAEGGSGEREGGAESWHVLSRVGMGVKAYGGPILHGHQPLKIPKRSQKQSQGVQIKGMKFSVIGRYGCCVGIR